MNSSYSRVLAISLIIILGGCAGVQQHTPVPAALSSTATVTGFSPSIRFWADEPPPNLDEAVSQVIAQYTAVYGDYYRAHGHYPTLNYLSISAGAGNGAFGAGLLSGWSATGHRPDFAIVSGVSAGALIAPFVFVGPEYDRKLKQLFTQPEAPNLISISSFGVMKGLMGGDALSDASLLAEEIRENITPDLVAKIAAEDRKGKRLLIATTNIEAQRGVLWNIGEIANSGNPKAVDLIRQIVLASVSVPGVIKPVLISVVAGGKHYDEMHADGGLVSQETLYPIQMQKRINTAFVSRGLERRLYVIRDSKVTPEYEVTQPKLFPIAFRSIETITKYQGIGDLYRLYLMSKRDHIDYNLSYIPDNFSVPSNQLFDPHYMSALFDVGYSMGMKGDKIWQKIPPNIEFVPDGRP
jgi:predicted acylesterase/phospholipase RssA